MQVSAQSWQGLGDSEDERYRIAATADGGIWLLRTPYPQPVCELAGTHRIIETATKVIGGMWGDEGSSRVQHAWTVNPQIARQAETGQAAYIHGGGATWVQVARPQPSPLPAPAAQPAPTDRHPCAGPRSKNHHPAGCAGGAGRRVRAGDPPMTTTDPFAALGLPARSDLSVEQIVAWRTVVARRLYS